MATVDTNTNTQSGPSLPTSKSSHDSVLREALEEIREMNRINSEALNRNKCSYCCRVDCDCDKFNVDRQYTCFNGHTHTDLDPPTGLKLGGTKIKAPCPLYTQKSSNVSVRSMSKYSNHGDNDEVPLWKQQNMNEKQPLVQRMNLKNHRTPLMRCLGATASVCIVGMLIVLIILAVELKRHDFDDHPLSPPMVAPGVIPMPGQSVYKMEDGSYFVCGHQTGEYSCQVVIDGDS